MPLCTMGRGQSPPGSLLMVPVVSDQGVVLGVLELGGAQDEQGRPCGFSVQSQAFAHSIGAQAGSAITNAQLTARLRQAQFETVFRLSVAAEFRDTETAAHVQRMSRYAEIIARGLGMSEDEVELIRFASPMHDVGKLGVPDCILLKPGALTPEETRKMRAHTVIGARILGDSESRLLQASEEVALAHHERFDGGGYPLGLKSDSIPMVGRVVALADALDAITSKRCYKEAESFDEGMAICRKDAATHFDPDCVTALEKGVDEAGRIHAQFSGADVEFQLTLPQLRLVV